MELLKVFWKSLNSALEIPKNDWQKKILRFWEQTKRMWDLASVLLDARSVHVLQAIKSRASDSRLGQWCLWLLDGRRPRARKRGGRLYKCFYQIAILNFVWNYFRNRNWVLLKLRLSAWHWEIFIPFWNWERDYQGEAKISFICCCFCFRFFLFFLNIWHSFHLCYFCFSRQKNVYLNLVCRKLYIWIKNCK